ncbi:hypothetical protein scyTo_0013025 [Scyliorhinus torazame]|uniref:Glucagon receptor n=1 Tax=Scyliorhinus torazame TaxID=75743 RepID=A0A401NMK4_SCYTO|nr:hypothetical protein [Scyliorhinus torazame]
MSQARFLILLVALSMNFQGASVEVLENTVEKWQRYSDDCFRNMSRIPQPKGVVCNRTFDKYACWPDGLPNTIVNVSCPWKLHCMRNYIHMNLFASFILRAVSILIKDALFKTQYKQITEDVDIKVWFNNETAAGCRTAQVLMQYCIGANYYWLLIEGIYLHNLLVIAVFSEKSYFNIYLCIGWGECWTTNENMAYWWIIRSPILLSILINFFIFIRIIHILVSKLRAHQMRYTDYKFRLAKSTLTLIPLLGIHEVVFAFITDEHAQGTLRHVKLFFDLFLNSFQGMLVAILYCFVNREVQSEILKKWKRWKLGQDIEEEFRHTYSQPPHVRNGSASLENHKLVSNYHNGTGAMPLSVGRTPPCTEKAESPSEQITLKEKLDWRQFPEGEAHKPLGLAESHC